MKAKEEIKPEYKTLTELKAFQDAGLPEPVIFDWQNPLYSYDNVRIRSYRFDGSLLVIPLTTGYLCNFSSVKMFAVSTLKAAVAILVRELKQKKI